MKRPSRSMRIPDRRRFSSRSFSARAASVSMIASRRAARRRAARRGARPEPPGDPWCAAFPSSAARARLVHPGSTTGGDPAPPIVSRFHRVALSTAPSPPLANSHPPGSSPCATTSASAGKTLIKEMVALLAAEVQTPTWTDLARDVGLRTIHQRLAGIGLRLVAGGVEGAVLVVARGGAGAVAAQPGRSQTFVQAVVGVDRGAVAAVAAAAAAKRTQHEHQPYQRRPAINALHAHHDTHSQGGPRPTNRR